ncbi:MAG: hypothetical protein IJ444_01560 [Kiritimatiellae bacterium]|nr:hypothetical protein [Kiritimatiellia bacterium]
MNIIYEPKGRAKEYSDLACNVYMGCPHGCTYCFAPGCMRKKAEEWHGQTYIRSKALELFRKDAKKLYETHDKRPILFSFLSDPYQPLEGELHLTRQCLQIVKEYGLSSKILTKGKAEYIEPDLELIKAAGTELGITISFMDDDKRRIWEPEAAPIEERVIILKKAHQMGIYTWVSLEPVIDPKEALRVISELSQFVDYWKIGKLNHNKEVEKSVDWYGFRVKAEELLEKIGAKYYIKEDLRKAKKN